MLSLWEGLRPLDSHVVCDFAVVLLKLAVDSAVSYLRTRRAQFL
jgi:hypothetical protein